MTQTRSYRFALVIAALVLAFTSFASAARMAPSEVDSPQVAAYLAMGGTLDDLCGEDMVAHTGECPFCHVTADVRAVRPAGQVWDVVPTAQPTMLVALIHGDQGGRRSWTPRAPPELA